MTKIIYAVTELDMMSDNIKKIFENKKDAEDYFKALI